MSSIGLVIFGLLAYWMCLCVAKIEHVESNQILFYLARCLGFRWEREKGSKDLKLKREW